MHFSDAKAFSKKNCLLINLNQTSLMMLALKLKPAMHLEYFLSFMKMMKNSIWLCLDIYCCFVFYDEIIIPDILIFSISHLGVALSSAMSTML